MTTDHLDAVAVFAVGVLLLIFIELRLRALFKRHEAREERMHATAVLTAEGASAGTRENARHIDELRGTHSDLRIDIDNLGALVKMHDGRLGALEERAMRQALLVPRARREEP